MYRRLLPVRMLVDMFDHPFFSGYTRAVSYKDKHVVTMEVHRVPYWRLVVDCSQINAQSM